MFLTAGIFGNFEGWRGEICNFQNENFRWPWTSWTSIRGQLGMGRDGRVPQYFALPSPYNTFVLFYMAKIDRNDSFSA